MSEHTSLKEIIYAIEAELDRLDATDSESNCHGIAVYADDNLPRGWVRLEDGYAWVYGPALEILQVLKGVESSSEDGWTLAWEAIAGFNDHPPTSTKEWPEELWNSEQLEEGTSNDEPITLIAVETNAGTRYACGPHGVHACALYEAIEYDCLHETREEAIESSELEGSDSNG